MRAHQCASNRWMRKHHKLHLKSQALLPALATSPEKDKPFQCQSNHASFSEVTLAVRPEEAANGRALGMGWRTKTAGAGSAAAKIIASLIARSRATATNLHPTSQVWGEDVVGIKMPPSKQLSSRLQLEKVMMVQLQAQQLMQPSQPSADGPGLGAEGNGALSSATSEVEKGGSSSCQSCDHGTIGGSHSVAEVSAYAQLEGDAAVKH